MAVSESDVQRVATELKQAETDLYNVGHRQYSSTNSSTDLRTAQSRRDECRARFERIYAQYRSEMQRADQIPRDASWWGVR